MHGGRHTNCNLGRRPNDVSQSDLFFAIHDSRAETMLRRPVKSISVVRS